MKARHRGLINNQIHNTIILASEIALNLGANATTPTILPLSQRLYGYGEYDRSQRLAELARDAARSVEDQVGALGFLKIRIGGSAMVSEGETYFKRAIDVTREQQLSRLPTLNAWLNGATQMDWARALVGLNCQEARSHFLEVTKILETAGHNIDLDRLREGVKRQQVEGIDGNRACLPESATLPSQ